MKVEALHLLAFGPFTDVRLDLSAGKEGLHVVYGPNEAGKSSALRALVDLFYEIPKHTSDDFVHSYGKLRIGGTLRPKGGTPFSVVRRKGTKGTLLSADDDHPLPDDTLTSLLEDVDRGFFTSFFGIDQPALVHGGEEILAEGGGVGQALFSAALPAGDLRTTLASLDNEAGALFKRNASKPSINRAVNELKQTKRLIKTASLTSAEWEGHKQELESATEKLADVTGVLKSLMARQRKLQRHAKVIPLLAVYRELVGQLEALGEVVLLPADFTEVRQKAQQVRKGAEGVRRKALTKLERLRAEAEELQVPQPILTDAETIEALHQRVGAYKSALEKSPSLRDQAQVHRREAEAEVKALRRDLDLETVEPMRAVLARKRFIQGIANRHQAVAAAESSATTALEKVENELSNTTSIIESLRSQRPEADAGNLRRVVDYVRKAGDLDNAIEDARIAHKELADEAEVELSRLPLFTGALKELERLPVPTRENFEGLGARSVELVEQRRKVEESLHEAQLNLSRIERHIEELRGSGGELPSEEALERSRGDRDETWSQIKSVLGPDHRREENLELLPEVFESQIRVADELADRLRREADRVQRAVSLRAEHAELLHKIDELRKLEEMRKEETGVLDQRWLKLWAGCGLEPLPPREMSGWRTSYERLLDRATSLRKAQESIERLESQRRDRREALERELRNINEPIEAPEEIIGPLLSRAEDLVAEMERDSTRLEDLTQRRSHLEEERSRASSTLEKAHKEHEEWRDDWSTSVRDLGLAEASTPDQAEDLLETLTSVFQKLDLALDLERRAVDLEREITSFRDDSLSCIRRLVPRLAELEVEQAVMQLNELLTDARRAATTNDKLKASIAELSEELDEAEAMIEGARQQLEDQCRKAGVQTESELEEAEELSARHRTLVGKHDQNNERLHQESDGASIEQLIEETAGVDPDQIPGQLDELKSNIKQLEESRDRLLESKGRQEAELARMDGTSQAAEAAEKVQEILAGLRRDVEQYVRVKLASNILLDQIERFTTENQSALLTRGGHFFEHLTLSSFNTLMTDFDDLGDPVIVGVRSSGEKIGVSAMSAGTRDQLYLALRLATLERYLDQTDEPMPFVVDDVLINFDDERSAATLEVLSDLSIKTQIILFTHHRRVRQMAEVLSHKGQTFLHDLVDENRRAEGD